ncbi:matrixin family metalloprotease [Enhygromyxa salina]|uniref:Peptidase M10 metallopeptidase domain-containing protein n=1 Tax=Enhygromyxa salina TaxID=215803 RepID=A0A2S9XTB4_9BACT|nr:matrixin family metalloprotease [Enhygromyxa salina]PRP96106.1 hypothetical protein ENSA7_69200 [Enhygromyxa salina]
MRTTFISITLAGAATTITALGMLHASTPAHAYNLNNARSGSSTTMYLDPAVQGAMPSHYTALHNAAAKLNANPSNMRFSLVNDNDAVVANNNGESEVAFTSNNTKLCGSLACAWSWSSGGTLVESDVYFDIDYDWTTTDAKADSVAYTGSGYRPLLNTALHEFSHALGLGHEGDVFNVLGNAWNVVSTNGASTESVISEDVSNGLIAHYGQRPSVNEDLSLYHWEWSANINGYSRHARTPITGPSGAALSSAPESNPSLNEPAYYVSSGQTLEVTQTAENRGTTQLVTIKWYLSTNSTITTSDTVLATSALNKGRNGPFTWTRSLSLPGGLVAGTRYWVGAIIDSEGVLAEQNEINNAMYVAEVVIQ